MTKSVKSTYKTRLLTCSSTDRETLTSSGKYMKVMWRPEMYRVGSCNSGTGDEAFLF